MIADGETIVQNWLAGNYKKPVTITKEGDKLWLKFGFNRTLLNEVKECFTGRRWNPERKQWSIEDCQHNWFQMAFLAGARPYDPYDSELINFKPSRNTYDHQTEMIRQILTRHYCILACEMGTGKTLAAIEAMEASGVEDWLWVGPRSALHSVELEFKKWNAKIKPLFKTYHSLAKYVENWTPGEPIHQGIIFDESHKLKNPTSQRSKAAMHMANAVRDEWGDTGFVVLMSGSPAPKSPLDWYNQCETARPGYIKERDIRGFKERMGLFQEADGAYGTYPKLITWYDDSSKCKKCGQAQDDFFHSLEASMDGTGHNFESSRNEVEYLYERMAGLCLVKFKKDCLDLPEKQYQIIDCPPSPSTMRAAKMIANNATSAIKALILLRELSDGFQYIEKENGRETCPLCNGSRISTHNPDNVAVACPTCKGEGSIIHYTRHAEQVKCPKEDALIDLLDKYDDEGRVVIYAGFTGSVERCVDIVRGVGGWKYIRVDGTGWSSDIGGNATGLLEAFQSHTKKYPRIAFIGNPGSAGTGLTLTASSNIIYYSNDFNADSRIQSEDRIHRAGMDTNRGATIYDLCHLETDYYILENLKKKKELQSMSLGELRECLKS